MRDSTRLTAIQQNSLWDFALDFYARPGVSQRLLRLQDTSGMDVCVLLWRLWLHHHGLVPTAHAERALADVHAWQREYTWPLRDRRRRLKPAVADDPALAPLRESLKEAELLAEKAALARLEAISQQDGCVRNAVKKALVAAHVPDVQACELTPQQHHDLALLWAQA